MWWVLRPGPQAHVQGQAGRGGEGPPELLGQLGVEGRRPEPGCPGRRARRRPGTAGPTGRGPPRSAPRRAGRASTRTAARPPCRPAPRPGTRRSRCPRPRRCGGRRPRGRPGPRRSRSKPACRPSCSTMWSKKGSPVDDDTWPVPSTTRVTAIEVSLVCAGARLGRPGAGVRRHGVTPRQGSSRAARKRSFSSGVPTVTRRHPSSPAQVEQSRTSTDRSSRPCHTSAAGRPGPEQDEVGVRRPGLDGEGGQRGGQPAPLLGHHGHPGLHLGPVAEGQHARPPGSGADRWYGQGHGLAGRHDLGVGHQVARAGRPPWTRSWRTCAPRPAGGRASSAPRSSRADQPGELAVGLVHHHQAGGPVEDPADDRRAARPDRSGCWASTGRRSPGRPPSTRSTSESRR